MCTELGSIVKKYRVGSPELQECFAETVLDDLLVECRIKLGMHDVPCTVIQKTDHICWLAIHVDTIFDIRLP